MTPQTRSGLLKRFSLWLSHLIHQIADTLKKLFPPTSKTASQANHPPEEARIEKNAEALDADEDDALDDESEMDESEIVEFPDLSLMAGEAANPYQNLRPEAYQKFQNILNRSILRNAILTGDAPLRYGFLAKLADERPVFTLNASQFFDLVDETGLSESVLLTQLMVEANLQKGAKDPLSRPTVFVLNEPDFIQTQRFLHASKRILQENPGLQLLINTPEHELNVDPESSLAYMLDGPVYDVKNTPTPLGLYETLKVPGLNKQEWQTLFNKEPYLKHTLDLWNLKLDKGALDALCHSLPENPAFHDLVLQLNTLGEHFNPKRTQTKKLNKRDIESFLQHQSKTQVSQNKLTSPDSLVKLLDPAEIDDTFENVIGLDEAKGLLKQHLDRLKYPNYYNKLYAQDPDGKQDSLLLHGPPGVGKTMLGRAAAKELEAPFLYVNASEFVRKYVGEGAENVEKLEQAIDKIPSNRVIVFIDELDSLGMRVASSEAGTQQYNNTINQLLALMDGIKKRQKQVLFMAATNFPENIDPALLERFNKPVQVKLPTPQERQAQLEQHLQQKGLRPTQPLNWEQILKVTDGMSGRALRSIMINLKQTLDLQTPADTKAQLEKDPKALDTYQPAFTQQQLLEAVETYKKRPDKKLTKTMGFQT